MRNYKYWIFCTWICKIQLYKRLIISWVPLFLCFPLNIFLSICVISLGVLIHICCSHKLKISSAPSQVCHDFLSLMAAYPLYFSAKSHRYFSSTCLEKLPLDFQRQPPQMAQEESWESSQAPPFPLYLWMIKSHQFNFQILPKSTTSLQLCLCRSSSFLTWASAKVSYLAFFVPDSFSLAFSPSFNTCAHHSSHFFKSHFLHRQ